MKTAIVSMLALVGITAFGSYHQSVVIPYVVIGAVCTVAVLAALGRIKSKEYPVYIYGISLVLLWQVTMLGVYIVGHDIHGEMAMVNKAIVDGWDLGFTDPNNTSIIVGWLAPLLAKVGFSPIWQFKALFPAVFACVPMILYYAYRKMIGGRRAFFAALFFIVVPVSMLEITGIAKSMVAEVFLAMMVLFMAINIKVWQKSLGIGVCVILASLCHYTVGILAVIYLVGSFLVLLIGRVVRLGFLQKMRVSFMHFGAIIIIAVVVTFLWFGNVAGGSIVRQYELIGRAFIRNIVEYCDFNGNLNGNLNAPENVAVSGLSDGISNLSGSEIADVKKPSYLYSQEPLVKTAIGLDFGEASVGGKAFRLLQYATQFLVVLGFAYLLFRHKKYRFTAEFMSCVVAGLGLMGLCLFFPGFSSLINATRFYQIALFFLAPMLVIGVEELGNDIARGVRCVKGL